SAQSRGGDRNALVSATGLVPDLAGTGLFFPQPAGKGSQQEAGAGGGRAAMMRFGLALLLTCSTAGLLHAQPPFDMSPERPTEIATGPATPVTPPGAPFPDRARDPVAPPPTVSSDYRRGLLPTGDLLLEGENATRCWAVHLTEAQVASPA